MTQMTTSQARQLVSATLAKYELLHKGVAMLAGQCDGAVRRDGVGFNGADTSKGHSFAERAPINWSPRMRRSAWRFLRKYRGQLAALGIAYDDIPEPPEATPELQDLWWTAVRLAKYGDRTQLPRAS